MVKSATSAASPYAARRFAAKRDVFRNAGSPNAAFREVFCEPPSQNIAFRDAFWHAGSPNAAFRDAFCAPPSQNHAFGAVCCLAEAKTQNSSGAWSPRASQRRLDCGRPKLKNVAEARTQNTSGGQYSKYKRRPRFKIEAEANTQNTSGGQSSK